MIPIQSFKILFVDDKANVRSFVGPAITAAGYQYLEAADGPTALFIIEEEQPDLIILDIMLDDPDFGGLDICKFRGSWDVFIMNSDGTGETQLTAQSGHQTNTRCSPAVARIAYHDGTQLVTMDLDGSNKTPISVAAYRNASSWSPDGSQILFNTNRDGNEELYVMDAGGSNQVRLTDSPAFDGNAAWSP